MPQLEDLVTQVSTGLLERILKYGIATPIALWLVYMGGTQLLAEVHQNTVAVQANTAVLQLHAEASLHAAQAVEQGLLRVERRQERVEAVNRQSCVNAAKNYAQWQNCWNAGDGK